MIKDKRKRQIEKYKKLLRNIRIGKSGARVEINDQNFSR